MTATNVVEEQTLYRNHKPRKLNGNAESWFLIQSSVHALRTISTAMLAGRSSPFSETNLEPMKGGMGSRLISPA